MADERSLVLQRQRQLKWKQLDWLETVLMALCGFTLFAFSQENWSRPEPEVSLLMQLFLRTLSKELEALHKNDVRLRFVWRPPLDVVRVSSAVVTDVSDAAAVDEPESSGIVTGAAVERGQRAGVASRFSLIFAFLPRSSRQ